MSSQGPATRRVLPDVTRWPLVVIVLLLAACAAPKQQGEVVIAPGATERALLAMRMGYIGFEREKVPGQVRQASMPGLLPEGGASEGKLGDWVLENGHVVAAVTAIDGTRRGGRLIDLAKKPKSLDGLGSVELAVLGQAVIYDSLRTGFDSATNAAYIEVSGRVDMRASGGALLTVSTRYDAAPGIEAILLHTHVKVDSGSVDPASELPLLDEVLSAQGPARGVTDPEASFGASFGDHGGYIVRALGDPGSVATASVLPSFRVPASAAPATGGALVVTRVLAPLDRADTAALAVALAKTAGEPVGDVEVRIAVGRGAHPPKKGSLTFVDAHGKRISVCSVDAKGEDSHFEAKLPAGVYTVSFDSAGLGSAPSKVRIEGERLAFVTVGVHPSPPEAAPIIEPLGCGVPGGASVHVTRR
jgi:hypothetical protein